MTSTRPHISFRGLSAIVVAAACHEASEERRGGVTHHAVTV